MQRRFGKHRAIIALTLAGLAMSLPGCVSARDTNAVAQSQAEAIGRLAVESAITNAALLDAMAALSSIRIERIASEVEMSIIIDLINPDASADHTGLEAMLAQPDMPSNPLAAQVRESRMTLDEARSWLSAYAEALQEPTGAKTRRRLLEALHPVVLARAESARLTAALRDRAESNGRLFADAHASALTLVGASTSDPSIDALLSAATESWKTLLLESIDDPEERAATERLLDSILDFTQLFQGQTQADTGANQ